MRRHSLVICFFICTGLHALAQTDPAAPKKPAPTPIPVAAAEPQIAFNSVHVDGPYIAMTFDDGPSEKLTPKLLDLLAAHHIKATFFVIGQNAADYPEIVKRALRGRARNRKSFVVASEFRENVGRRCAARIKENR